MDHSDGLLMEGDGVRTRLWSLILHELPFPFRWVGMELIRVVHWLDHGMGRVFHGVRRSPAWFFVTLVGSFAVCLTVLLFVSLIGETNGGLRLGNGIEQRFHSSRRDLEKSHEWSAQDRWRVAHMFVPHKPVHRHFDIPLDTRLLVSDTRSYRRSSRNMSASRTTQRPDLDVRLDLSRPKIAEQGNRLVSGMVVDPKRPEEDSPSRIRSEQRQLIVQAAWEYRSDCEQPRDEYAYAPVRRPVPVPQPSFDEIPPYRSPTPQAEPHLSYEFEMKRLFAIEGVYPPGSHLVQTSERSSFPSDESTSRQSLVAHHDHLWKRWSQESHRFAHEHPPQDVARYRGVGLYDRRQEPLLEDDEYDDRYAAVAEVNLSLELVMPHTTLLGHPQQSKLLVSNEGSESVSRIEVRDFVAHSQIVVGANPDAQIELGTDLETGLSRETFHRELHDLHAGHERELTLKWLPSSEHRQVHRTQVVAYAVVSTLTVAIQPDPDQQMPSIPPEALPKKYPSVACDVDHLEQVYVGEEVEMKLTLRNTGETTLHAVKIEVDIPRQLSHPDGPRVIVQAGNIPVLGVQHAILRLSAVIPGEAINRLHLQTNEQVEARGSAAIVVVSRPSEKPIPTPISSKPIIPRPLAKPLPALPINNCCCQPFIAVRFEPLWYFP